MHIMYDVYMKEIFKNNENSGGGWFLLWMVFCFLIIGLSDQYAKTKIDITMGLVILIVILVGVIIYQLEKKNN